MPVPAKSENSSFVKFLPAFLGTFIVLLTVATVGLLAAKRSGGKEIAQKTPNQPIFIEKHQPVDTSGFLTKEEADRYMTNKDCEVMVSGVQERLDSLEHRMDVWQHRVWLLSLAHNENTNLVKQKFGDAGYITFSGDWKLNRMPQTMKLTEEQKTQLRQADVVAVEEGRVQKSCTNHSYYMIDHNHMGCKHCNALYTRNNCGAFVRVK